MAVRFIIQSAFRNVSKDSSQGQLLIKWGCCSIAIVKSYARMHHNLYGYTYAPEHILGSLYPVSQCKAGCQAYNQGVHIICTTSTWSKGASPQLKRRRNSLGETFNVQTLHPRAALFLTFLFCFRFAPLCLGAATKMSYFREKVAINFSQFTFSYIVEIGKWFVSGEISRIFSFMDLSAFEGRKIRSALAESFKL